MIDQRGQAGLDRLTHVSKVNAAFNQAGIRSCEPTGLGHVIGHDFGRAGPTPLHSAMREDQNVRDLHVDSGIAGRLPVLDVGSDSDSTCTCAVRLLRPVFFLAPVHVALPPLR